MSAEEQRDKESRRRNNLILYKVPESNAARADERNKEDAGADPGISKRGGGGPFSPK